LGTKEIIFAKGDSERMRNLFRVKDPEEVRRLVSLVHLEPWVNGVPGCIHELWVVFRSPERATRFDFCRACFGSYQMPKEFFAEFERLARAHRRRAVMVRYVALVAIAGGLLFAAFGKAVAALAVCGFLLVLAAAGVWRILAARDPEVEVRFRGYTTEQGSGQRAQFEVRNASPFPVVRGLNLVQCGTTPVPLPAPRAGRIEPVVLKARGTELLEVEPPTGGAPWRLLVSCRRSTGYRSDVLLEAATWLVHLGVRVVPAPAKPKETFYSDWVER
jgi:hypothetical protein